MKLADIQRLKTPATRSMPEALMRPSSSGALRMVLLAALVEDVSGGSRRNRAARQPHSACARLSKRDRADLPSVFVCARLCAGRWSRR